MKAIVAISRRKPLMIFIVVTLGIIIFSSSFFIRRHQIALDNEFQKQSLGVSTALSALDTNPFILDLVVEGKNIRAIIGSEKTGECTLFSDKQVLKTAAKDQACIFNDVDFDTELIKAKFVSDDKTEYMGGKITF